MKAVIIDDESKARRLLKVLIEENCKSISEIYESSNLLEGIELIKTSDPAIVFLDIEMPGHTGLEILEFINKDEFNFEIIFTTAYSEYAINAIQLSALDYLLKPVRASKLKQAVEKVNQFLGKSKVNQKIEELRSVFETHSFKKIGLPVKDGVEFVAFNDIIMMEADGMYTKISTRSKGELLISKPLKYFVEILRKVAVFYKPHRSYLINLEHIQKYVKADGGYIIMENNKSVSISKDKIEEFIAVMQGL
jgi:two-component system LytT family response regulator